jgi:hypothetical protein
MTLLQLSPDTLSVRFTILEKVAGLIRDLDVPLAAVHRVSVEPDGLRATHGVRAPGLGLPGYRKIGTWRGRGRKSLVSVRRGQPALRIALRGERYDELVLGLDDAASWQTRLTEVTDRA